MDKALRIVTGSGYDDHPRGIGARTNNIMKGRVHPAPAQPTLYAPFCAAVESRSPQYWPYCGGLYQERCGIILIPPQLLWWIISRTVRNKARFE
jgi:hypothetical protein